MKKFVDIRVVDLRLVYSEAKCTETQYCMLLLRNVSKTLFETM